MCEILVRNNLLATTTYVIAKLPNQLQEAKGDPSLQLSHFD